jgi:hypothetical protein
VANLRPALAPERQSAALAESVLQRRHAASKMQGFFSKTIKPFFLCTKVTGGGDGFIAEPKVHLHGNLLYSFLAVAVADTHSDGSFFYSEGRREGGECKSKLVKLLSQLIYTMVLFSTSSLRSVFVLLFSRFVIYHSISLSLSSPAFNIYQCSAN